MKRANKYIRAGRNSDKAYVWYMKHQVIQKPPFLKRKFQILKLSSLLY